MDGEERRSLIADLGEETRRATAAEQLLPLVYDELRALAATYLRREGDGHSLQPTLLVHEAFLRIAKGAEIGFKSRAHFFAVAAKVIRQILIDRARKRRTDRHGGAWTRISLDERLVPERDRETDVLALDDAMRRLQELHGRPARVAELRFFGGLTLSQTAGVLDISRKTASEDWSFARAWLSRALSDDPPAEAQA